MKQRENKLIDLLCTIPFENWNKSETEFEGKKIILNKMNGGGNFWFTIDGEDFFSEKDDKGERKINTYGYALCEYNSEKEKQAVEQRREAILAHFKIK